MEELCKIDASVNFRVVQQSKLENTQWPNSDPDPKSTELQGEKPEPRLPTNLMAHEFLFLSTMSSCLDMLSLLLHSDLEV